MKEKNKIEQLSPEVELAQRCVALGRIPGELYLEHNVYRGLRDLNGNGVLTGLTRISDIVSKRKINDDTVPCAGELYYRGYSIDDIVNGFVKDGRFGFEEVTYLLIFGTLPTEDELNSFKLLLNSYRSLPDNFVRDITMKKPSSNMMNNLARSVLMLYAYDENPDSTETSNVLAQCLRLIAQFPLLSIYGYHAYNYRNNITSRFFIHDPDPNLSTAENILYMLRQDGVYTPLEASALDVALVLHAEHGGGNNSTFTTHVVSSSGTDTYSAIAAALGSLKGPKHGGANIKVCQMFEDIKSTISDWTDKDAVSDYLRRILKKEAFDHSGLIYGIGHAVYSVSDPRTQILKEYVRSLSEEKGLNKEFALYSLVEELSPKVISESRNMYKGVSANVDFYSGFLYSMLGLPVELYTPLFAIARIAGWSAHRIEELINAGKIIRPSYKNVQPKRSYRGICER